MLDSRKKAAGERDIERVSEREREANEARCFICKHTKVDKMQSMSMAIIMNSEYQRKIFVVRFSSLSEKSWLTFRWYIFHRNLNGLMTSILMRDVWVPSTNPIYNHSNWRISNFIVCARNVVPYYCVLCVSWRNTKPVIFNRLAMQYLV